jgi:protein-S-isoprenylcysteine O-methyltransferase Ste14
MRRKLALAYGIVSYLIFLAVYGYAIGFVGNVLVPKSIDSGATGPLWLALPLDVLLLGLFGIQHSGMARPGFKLWWTKIVPRPIERSTYVLLASLSLVLLFWAWRPLPAVIWNVELAWVRWLLWGLYGLGWLLTFVAARMISSDHLFGLQQVRAYRDGRKPSPLRFQTPGLYRYVRHPLMLGFLIAFWVTPRMTLGHLLFATVMTGYILIGLQLEERDLTRRFGERYGRYREQVPMLIPRLGDGTPRQAGIGTGKSSRTANKKSAS